MQRFAELRPDLGELVAPVFVLPHELAAAQLVEPLVEHARRHAVAMTGELTRAERPRLQLPQDAQRPASADEVEGGHEWPSGRRASNWLTGQRRSGHRDLLARFVYRNDSLIRMSAIAPLEPPFEAEVAAELEQMMPPGAPPIALFRTFAKNLPMTRAMRPWGSYELSRALSLSLREREIVIDRTCAGAGCEYEWGVHVAFFAAKAALTSAQITSLTFGDATDACWTLERERLLIEPSTRCTTPTTSQTTSRAARCSVRRGGTARSVPPHRLVPRDQLRVAGRSGAARAGCATLCRRTRQRHPPHLDIADDRRRRHLPVRG